MTRSARGETTATRVLDAALAQFAEHGFAGFTIHAIVERSGVSLGSIYHHFGSMDGVAAALYARSMGQLLDAIVVDVERARSARSGIVALVRAYLRFTANHRAAALFIHASSYQGFLPAHVEVIAAAKTERIARLFAWLRPHVEERRIVALPEPLFEALVIGPIAEVARRHLAGVPGFDLRGAETLLSPRIWRAVARGPR